MLGLVCQSLGLYAHLPYDVLRPFAFDRLEDRPPPCPLAVIDEALPRPPTPASLDFLPADCFFDGFDLSDCLGPAAPTCPRPMFFERCSFGGVLPSVYLEARIILLHFLATRASSDLRSRLLLRWRMAVVSLARADFGDSSRSFRRFLRTSIFTSLVL